VISKLELETIRSSILRFSSNNNLLIIASSIICGISFLSLIYFGGITVRDASTGNTIGPNDLPKTSVGRI
jgi:hypothetical protein